MQKKIPFYVLSHSSFPKASSLFFCLPSINRWSFDVDVLRLGRGQQRAVLHERRTSVGTSTRMNNAFNEFHKGQRNENLPLYFQRTSSK